MFAAFNASDDDSRDDESDEEEEEVSPESFEVLSMLGRGGYASCYAVKHKRSGRIYCLKVQEESAVEERKIAKFVWRERHALAAVRSPYVCRLRWAFASRAKLFLVTEFCQGGDLFYHMALRYGAFLMLDLTLHCTLKDADHHRGRSGRLRCRAYRGVGCSA